MEGESEGGREREREGGGRKRERERWVDRGPDDRQTDRVGDPCNLTDNRSARPTVSSGAR